MDTKTVDKSSSVQTGNTTNLKIVVGVLVAALFGTIIAGILFTVTSITSLNTKDQQIHDLKENITEITNLPTPTPVIIR